VLELMPGGPVIDVVAIQLALMGGRRVELNRSERLIAAAFILAGGGRQADVVARLGISRSEVSRMHARICSMVEATAA
jgi:DNA-directed RNA polymerase specialized sigma subunit